MAGQPQRVDEDYMYVFCTTASCVLYTPRLPQPPTYWGKTWFQPSTVKVFCTKLLGLNEHIAMHWSCLAEIRIMHCSRCSLDAMSHCCFFTTSHPAVRSNSHNPTTSNFFRGHPILHGDVTYAHHRSIVSRLRTPEGYASQDRHS